MPITIKRFEFYKKLGFKKIGSEYLLYNVYFNPIVYGEIKNINKEKYNKILTIDITNASDEEKKKLFIRGRLSAFEDFRSRKSPKAEAKKIKSIHDISLYKFFLQKLQLYNTKMQLKILIQCIQMQLVLSQ